MNRKLSVIIVNYNVKNFLEQCLHSVYKAVKNFSIEIIVIDNQSSDGSVDYLKSIFPSIHFIVNQHNLGFGKANNQGLAIAKGEYILFLNPDTIVPEDCFEQCFSFFDHHSDCGALGIRMLDGNGIFLPESKRSFPSPTTAFYKLSGLSTLFPKSVKFNKYALGYLSEKDNHQVEVLAGAFIMTKKSIVYELKGFDEAFFMYGEDVDLSYRFQTIGYKNYYLGSCPIIHFKGESTKRDSFKFIKMFYGAMDVFVQKHYDKRQSTIFSFLIQIAVGTKALSSFMHRIVNKITLPLIDAIIIFFALFFTETSWVNYITESEGFQNFFVPYAISLFTVLFWSAAYFNGNYDNLSKPSKAFFSSLSATLVMLAAYSLLPESIRFSRGVILFGGIFAGLLVTLNRWILIQINLIPKEEEEDRFRQTIIVGSEREYEDVLLLLQKAHLQHRILGRIQIHGEGSNAIGSLESLHLLLDSLPIREVIFCEGTLTNKEIIELIQTLSKKISFRFHGSNSASIVGSDSKIKSGETVTEEGYYALSKPYSIRMKKVLDISVAFLLLITFPIQFILNKNGLSLLTNAWKVLIGKKTWVGYTSHQKKLPPLPVGILSVYGYPIGIPHPLTIEGQQKLDVLYAKDYDWFRDLRLIFTHYKKLGTT